MSDQIPVRPITAVQLVALVVASLALFFVVAFVTKSIEAYRLRLWRDRLEVEIKTMAWLRDDLQDEVRQRSAPAYAERVLREAGLVGPGQVAVIGVTPVPTVSPLPASGVAVPTPEALPMALIPADQRLFHNPIWQAWKRLLWGFD